MKTDIHPEYRQTTFVCSCGNTFQAGGTKDTIHVELCNLCHPFYTGKQKLVDTGGRVERYKQRYAKSQAAGSERAESSRAAKKK